MVVPLRFYRPGKKYPAFSVTGGRCELQCEHCRGRYLSGMRAVLTSEQLLHEVSSLEASGGTGFLLSGGCDARGRVPLGPFLGAVRQIKEGTSLTVNLHPGLVDAEAARALLASGADAFSVDVLQDRQVIAGRLHLDASPQDYRRTLELLSPGTVVPHVCVGLQSERGEEDTLDLLSSVRIEALVVLGLMAPPGFSDGSAVPTDRLLRFVRQAVRRIDAPVLLGCMRPRGRADAEIEIIKAGAAGVVNPASATVAWARAAGVEAAEVQACCALHR
ncbi:MAG: radical SAM protein [Methanomassiliicoccus sp.]|nr:radical SAM protein [Methanomassiliicoccus sp.]